MGIESTFGGLADGVAGDLGFGVSAGQSALAPNPPSGTSGKGIPTGRAYAIASAASKYHVPIWVMVGVYGMETDFGRLVDTSSTGAIGDFQFEPATAQSYNYPMTNSPNAAQFSAQADSAAHYLSDLFKQTGSWNSALQHYSGGGYGQAQVEAKAKQAPKNLDGIVNSTGFTSNNPFGSVTKSVGSGVDAIASVLQFLISKQFGYLIVGAVLVLVALILIARK